VFRKRAEQQAGARGNGASALAGWSVTQSTENVTQFITSGHVGDEALHSGLLGPESAFLRKPFPPDALITCARSLLDKARIR
jgi:hypothetical protein